MTRSRIRSIALVTLVACAALSVAACGGDEGSSEVDAIELRAAGEQVDDVELTDEEIDAQADAEDRSPANGATDAGSSTGSGGGSESGTASQRGGGSTTPPGRDAGAESTGTGSQNAGRGGSTSGSASGSNSAGSSAGAGSGITRPEAQIPTSIGVAADQDVVETVAAAGGFDKATRALEVAGLDKMLSSEGPFTVFAPSDDALDAIPDGAFELMLRSPPVVANLLRRHIVRGDVALATITPGTELTAIDGSTIRITRIGSLNLANDVAVSQPDVKTTNGRIHVIDSVLA